MDIALYNHDYDMDVKELFHPNACDPRGMASKNKWTRTEYFKYKKTLESD
jgi:hypothetical protein